MWMRRTVCPPGTRPPLCCWPPFCCCSSADANGSIETRGSATGMASRWPSQPLSMDEIAGLHETVNSLIDFSWTIPGGILAALFDLAYLRFLLHLPSRTRWLFLLSGIIFVTGAVVVERSTDWYDDEDLLNTLPYNLWNALEEGLEMGGVVLFNLRIARIYDPRSKPPGRGHC